MTMFKFSTNINVTQDFLEQQPPDLLFPTHVSKNMRAYIPFVSVIFLNSNVLI